MDWKRHGLKYVSEYSVVWEGTTHSRCHVLSFVSYWLIRWFHGEAMLDHMSARSRLIASLSVGEVMEKS